MRYRQNASLTDYVLVSQFTPGIELFSRQADGRWLYSFEMSLAGSLAIASIERELQLAEVYDRIEFPAPEEPKSPYAAE